MVNLWLRSPSKFFPNSFSNIHHNLELYFISYAPRKEGIIHQYTINNLAIGRSVDETMRTLQALQYMQDNSGGQLFSPSKHVETPTTMQLTLHPSLAITTATTNSLPGPNKFPSNTPNFPSLSCRRNLHFPSCSSTKTFISLPPKPPKPPEIPLSPPPNPLSNFHEQILYLDSIGIDYFSLLSTHPSIVSVSAAELKSVVNFLRSTAGLTITDIRRMVAMCPEVLTSKISSLIPVFTFLLREAGVDGTDLRHVIHRRPRLLVCSVEARLRPTLYFLQSIGITSIKRHTSLLSCSVEQKFVPRIEYFRKIGFSQRDTMAMFRRFPPLFCYSIKDNFEPKLDYLVTEMRRELKELKEFPQYFSFSLENRIKPRHRRCVERSVSLALPVMLKTSEERFEGRLEMFCNSSIPVRTSPLWCATYEITALSNHSAELKKLNTGLLGVSNDGVFVVLQALQYTQENSGGQLFSPSKHVETPTTMQSALHPSLAITTATANSLPGPNNFPSNTPNFPSLSCHRNLHFPSSSSTKTLISLPPKPPKPPEIPLSLPPNPLSNFQEEILYLDSIGIDYFSLLSTHPSIISVSAADLKSVVHFLRSTASLTTTGIRRVVAMCPEVLTSKISSLIPVFTFLLREAGVDGSDLRHVIHRRPRLLVCSVEARLRPTLYFLQSIGITSIKRHTSLLSCSVEQKFVPRIEYFRKIGFSQRDTMAMFRRFPPLFCYSIKDNFEPKFDYFVTEMRRELKELQEFPQYFSFSLENRIKPRHKRCVEKSVSLALPVMLKTNEERFEGRLEMLCNSSIPVRTFPSRCATYDDSVL